MSLYGRSGGGEPQIIAPLRPSLALRSSSCDPGVYVFERDQGDGVQALRVVRAELGNPVVIDPEAGALQVRVLQTKQRHAQGGVQHLGLHAVNVLVLEALGRIPAAGPGRLIALVQMVFEFLAAAAGAKAARNRKGLDVGRDKDIRRFSGVFDDLGGLVAVFFIQALLPQIGRFHHVRVGRYDLDLCHGVFLLFGAPTIPPIGKHAQTLGDLV